VRASLLPLVDVGARSGLLDDRCRVVAVRLPRFVNATRPRAGSTGAVRGARPSTPGGSYQGKRSRSPHGYATRPPGWTASGTVSVAQPVGWTGSRDRCPTQQCRKPCDATVRGDTRHGPRHPLDGGRVRWVARDAIGPAAGLQRPNVPHRCRHRPACRFGYAPGSPKQDQMDGDVDRDGGQPNQQGALLPGLVSALH
jgi:hypothetical protein